ncbi:MAG: hypothetical protein HY716_10045 [Planctomycetes bacterium]|nr:hypothetical protein [Planctomycetota bacterium]
MDRPPAADEVPYRIVPFSLEAPPIVEDVLSVVRMEPARLVVVTRVELSVRVREYLENVTRGDGRMAREPAGFTALVIPRPPPGADLETMKRPLLGALMHIVAGRDKVLWLPPAE